MNQDAEMQPPHSQPLPPKGPGTTTCRALFVSDIHLGTRACRAGAFLDFLRHYEAETIYLVGDIIDFWRVRRGPVWLQSHNDVLQKLLRKVRKGTRLVYIPGNHDEALRAYCGMHFGGIEIRHDAIHVTATGRRLLVMHGDEFDVVVRYARWLALLGERSYEFLLWANHPLNWVRRRFGFGYWSLSAYLKMRVKAAVNFIGEYEDALVAEARRRDADGIICGHIHHAANRMIGDIQYINCGDWVESRTAIAEDERGELHLIGWPEPVPVPAKDTKLPALAPQIEAPLPALSFHSTPAPAMAEPALPAPLRCALASQAARTGANEYITFDKGDSIG